MSFSLSRANARRRGMRGFGDISGEAWTVGAANLYVLRFTAENLPLTQPKDLLPFVTAVGSTNNLNFDVRGIAVWQNDDQLGIDGDWTIDIVLTVSYWEMPWPFYGDDGPRLATKVLQNAAVRGAFPNLTIDTDKAVLAQVTAPPQAIDFWKSQPVLWDHALPGTSGGGPTNTFATPAANSFVQGKVDDGTLATPWPVAQTPITPPTPTPTNTTRSGSLTEGETFIAVVGIGLLGYLLYEYVF